MGQKARAAMMRRLELELPTLAILKKRWERGLEPPTFGTTIRRSNQLSYTHRLERISVRRLEI